MDAPHQPAPEEVEKLRLEFARALLDFVRAEPRKPPGSAPTPGPGAANNVRVMRTA